MGTLPNSVGFATDIRYVSQPTLTWLIERNRVIGQDSGLAAMRQAVELILRTERFEYQIYTSNYGTETNDLIGESADYLQSEIQRRVTEALLTDDRVTGVSGFQFFVHGDTMDVSFDVETVIGTFTEALTI